MITNPKVDFYFTKEEKWQQEIVALRNIVLDCGLTEELKWGCPCYTESGKNIVLIHVFKEYCALLFFKGALLDDPDSLLTRQSENVQLPRQARFTGKAAITAAKKKLRTYIYQAVEVEKLGLKLPETKKAAQQYPEEFTAELKRNAKLRVAFEALTPGRQRAYNLYFSQPKQSKTRQARIEKAVEKILAGKGLNDD